MGKGASDAEARFSHYASFIPDTDLCDVQRAGQFTLWLQSEEECRMEGGSDSLVADCTRKRPEVLADVREILFLLCILFSSRFFNFSGSKEIRVKKFNQLCKGGTEKMLWSVRAWGVVSAALVLIFLFPSFPSWAPAEAMRPLNGQLGSERGMLSLEYKPASSISSHGVFGPQSFQEAPQVRNGKNCPTYSGNAPEDEFVCDPASVHIAMTLDGAYLRGSMAAVFSILQHASCPENVVFHFFVTENDNEFRILMRSTFPFLKFKIYHFDEKLVRDRISSSVRQDLEQPLNYARNYMADLLESCVGRVIYLDSDLVVVDDIAKLWAISLGPHTVGAPEYCHANFTKYFSSSFWQNASLSSTFDGRTPCYFNTGVMIIDLNQWRQNNFTRKIEQWMEVQKERRIYELGSLPPFLLVFAGSVEPVEHRWNQHGLGGDNVRGSCRHLHPGPVSLLHWSGEGKPWRRLDSRQSCPLDSLWAPYDLYVHSFY